MELYVVLYILSSGYSRFKSWSKELNLIQSITLREWWKLIAADDKELYNSSDPSKKAS